MMECPACGYRGDPERQYLKGFILLVCAECGSGVGLERKGAADPGVAPESQTPRGDETPGTGAYKLSPTGQHSVVSHQMVQRAPAAQVAEPEAARLAANLVYLVADSTELLEAAGQSGSESEAVGLIAGFPTATEMIESFANGTRNGDIPDAIVIYGDSAGFPADQLVFVIRSIETGVDAEKTPILVFCDDDAAWTERIRGLGSMRAVTTPAGLSHEELCARMIAQVQRLS